jgi:hypothetical protein
MDFVRIDVCDTPKANAALVKHLSARKGGMARDSGVIAPEMSIPNRVQRRRSMLCDENLTLNVRRPFGRTDVHFSFDLSWPQSGDHPLIDGSKRGLD